MNEVFIGAADDVMISDGNRVDAATAGLQDVDTLQRANVPNLSGEGGGSGQEESNMAEKDDFRGCVLRCDENQGIHRTQHSHFSHGRRS